MTLLSLRKKDKVAHDVLILLLELSNGGKQEVLNAGAVVTVELGITRQQYRGAMKRLCEYGFQPQNNHRATTAQPQQFLIFSELQGFATTEQPQSNHKTTTKPTRKPPQKFIPPTQKEVSEFYIQHATEKGVWKDFSPEQFVEFYAARNWHLSNGDPMKNWRIAITGTWVSSPKRRVITEQQWRMNYNNEKPNITLGVGEFIDSRGYRRYKLSSGVVTQTIVPIDAPPRENIEQLWSQTNNKWYYE